MYKKVYLRTYGCQMNVRDSEVICGLLKTNNYQLITKPEEAEVIIFNTCSVRQRAEDKVWSEVGRIKKGQSPAGAAPLIGIVGCTAQNYKQDVFKRAPGVDFVVGPSDIHKIPEIIAKLSAIRYPLSAIKIWETDGNSRPEEIYHTGFYQDKKHAYVVISEGCSNFCSYCLVPYVRGNLRNRGHNQIIKEIKEAVDKGINQITLLGQNVNAYKYDQVDFIKLLELVNAIKGLKEFSFITSHPKDTSIELFKIMRDAKKIKKHLHLPVQSGSNRILKLMNRQYTREYYLDLSDKYRRIIKNAALTTDIIVGFPNESEEDFRQTYDLVKKVKFNAAYIFKYSTRPHTQAEMLVDDIEVKEKEKRHKAVLDLQREISNKIQNIS